jgi:nucleotide-binding universal stress UspA family protein
MTSFPTKILAATDGSEDAVLAARAAIDLSARTGAEVHVVHAWRDVRPATLPAMAVDEYARAYEHWEQEAGQFLEEQAERLKGAGGKVAGTHLRTGRPAEEVVGLAEELGADLMVVGSRGLGGVKRLAVGSVSEGVVSLAPCPILVVRGGEGVWPPTRIVIGADLSEEAKKAAELAMSFGGALGAEVLLVLAYERRMVMTRGMGDPRPLMEADRARNRAWEALSQLSAGLESVIGVRPESRAVLGDAAAVIQEAAEEGEGPTLVVVGRRGMGAVARFALGSVSSAVLRSVSGPVLIVPSPRGES